eukprot:3464757-Amphidinium_carterae.2
MALAHYSCSQNPGTISFAPSGCSSDYTTSMAMSHWGPGNPSALHGFHSGPLSTAPTSFGVQTTLAPASGFPPLPLPTMPLPMGLGVGGGQWN